jgi:hypothetical protein
MVNNTDESTQEVVVKKKAGRPKGTKAKLNRSSSKSIAPEFLKLCKEGLSLIQISAKLDIPKETLVGWSTDKKTHNLFSKAFLQGQTAWQAYHENLLQKMISGEDGKKYAAAEISAQQFILKTQFKADWTEKQDVNKIEINNVARMSDEQLEQQILNLLSKSNIQSYLNSSLADDSNKLKLVVNNDG